jgi:hypothetical protein
MSMPRTGTGSSRRAPRLIFSDPRSWPRLRSSIEHADHVHLMVNYVLPCGRGRGRCGLADSFPKIKARSDDEGLVLGAGLDAFRIVADRSGFGRRRQTQAGNRSGGRLRHWLQGRRFFDMPASEAFETSVHLDHVHAAFRTGRSDFKASQGKTPRWTEQFLSHSAGKHREGVRLETAWTVAIPDSNAGWSVACQQRCFPGYFNREANAV